MCQSQKNFYIQPFLVYLLELQYAILFINHLISFIITPMAECRKKLSRLLFWIILESDVLRRSLKNLFWNIWESSTKSNHVRVSAFISKIKRKNTLPWMFFRNLSRIFQNNYFVEHFRVAPFLIREVFCLNIVIYILFGQFNVSWVLFTSVRSACKLLASPLRWRLGTRLFLWRHGEIPSLFWSMFILLLC